MSSLDDSLDGAGTDEFPLHSPENGARPHASPRGKGRLALVSGAQVVVQSHGDQISQRWRLHKTATGGISRAAKSDYSFRVVRDTQKAALSAAEAVAIALREVVPPRGLMDCAEITQIAHGTLRRLRDGQQSVKDEQIRALRRYPGFSERFDELIGAEVDDDYSDAARRLAEAFPGQHLESLVYQLENAARFLDAGQIAESLKTVSGIAAAGARSGEKRSPESARKPRRSA